MSFLYPKRVLPLIVFLLLHAAAYGQRIVGRVTDEATGEPVAGATIYANNSQLMTQTDATGLFRLRALPAGSSLIVTHINYQKQSIELRNPRDTVRVLLSLKDTELEGATVSVKNRDTWKRWGALFTEFFIGKDEAAQQCRLLNPEVLYFRFNDSAQLLTARARGPLLLENRLLGYRMHVDMDRFEFSYRDGGFFYISSCFFEPLAPANAAEDVQFAAGRLLAYRGSRMHFFRSLYRGQLAEEGFHLYGFRSRPNWERMRVESVLLQAKARQNRNARGTVVDNDYNIPGFVKDSARYYQQMMSKPAYLFDDTTRLDLNGRWQTAGYGRSFFINDTLLLQYDQQAIDAAALQRLKKWTSWAANNSNEAFLFLQNKATVSRYSLLYLKNDSLLGLAGNGYILNKGALVTEGHLGEMRTAFDLPIDYEPGADFARLTGSGSPLPAYAAVTEKIDSTLQAIGARADMTALFLHLDKTIYDPNENIWFSAYVLRSPFGTDEHHTLQVSLIEQATGKTINAEQFAMNTGLGSGYLFLPDSLPAGEYTLQAFTNTWPREPGTPVFRQSITLRGFQDDTPAVRNNTAGATPPPVKKTKQKVRMQWFPEGGDLVHNLPARLAFEARDPQGKPLSIEGTLLEDGRAVADLSSRGTGYGLVPFVPRAGARYTVSLKSDSLVCDSCGLPPVLLQGYSLQVEKGVVRDSVEIRVRSTRPDETVFLLLHDYHDAYRSLRLVPGVDGYITRIPVKSLPGGPFSITLFDASAQPVAERTLFHEVAPVVNMKIETDSAAYHKRQKVEARLVLTDAAGNPAAGVFSLSCARVARIDTLRYQTIVPFAAWQRYGSLQGWATQQPLFSLGTEEVREEMLRTQCWTRYRWNELSAGEPPAPLPFDLSVKGHVTHRFRRPGRPVEIIFQTSEGLKSVMTDDNGSFALSPDDILTAPDWVLQFFINTVDKEDWQLQFDQDRDSVLRLLAARPQPPLRQTGPWTRPDEQEHKASKQLAAVVVRKTNLKPEDYLSKRQLKKKKEKEEMEHCGDYVCMYNILNCINHGTGRPPQIGEKLRLNTAQGVVAYVVGCGEITLTAPSMFDLVKDPRAAGPLLFRMRGRYYTKDFYVADYTKFNPESPETLATVYWNPMIVTNAKGEATVSFYSNDLEGRFLLMAQGIGNAQPVQAAASFEVKR